MHVWRISFSEGGMADLPHYRVDFYCTAVHSDTWIKRARFGEYADALQWAQLKSAETGLPIKDAVEKKTNMDESKKKRKK